LANPVTTYIKKVAGIREHRTKRSKWLRQFGSPNRNSNGSLVNGELKYVGSVTEGISEDVQKELSRRLPELKRETAFIECSGSGIWVKPVIACKTSFRSWTEETMLKETKFKELMAEIGGVE
jgi:ATP-dependent DNA ligase